MSRGLGDVYKRQDIHKAQKRSVTVKCTLLITSGVKVSQIPLNWYVGGETNPFLGMLAFGNTSGQEVGSAPHCLPATRGHHSLYLTGQDTVCFGY